MNATLEITKGVWIPFVGTSLGAVCAIFMKKQLVASLQRVLSGFAAGVMVAASVWSLLLPAIDQAFSYGTWAFIPAALGFWLGVFFLLFLNRAIPRLPTDSGESGGLFGRTKRTAMLVLAVTIHNIP
ncbi:MAG TPA: ZIP zinc transporter, partial [Ruminococcaceae bacterium]|nr:ZIP zinc transporter [Oscillospiraceae bacterium]